MRQPNTAYKILLLGTLSLATFLPSTSFASTGVLEQTWTATGNDSAETTSKTFGSKDQPSWGWANIAIPSNAAKFKDEAKNPDGKSRVMTNYWNEDTVGGNVKNSTLKLEVNDQNGSFTITKSPDSYYRNGNPQTGCKPASNDPQDPCRWAPTKKYPYNSIHAPAAYPAIYKGCHYNQCTASGQYSLTQGKPPVTVKGAPFPSRIDKLPSFPIRWEIDTSDRKSTAVFNASFDIWFHRDMPVGPTGIPKPDLINQNTGLELMIWINHQGYKKGGVAKGAIIQPAGTLTQSNVSIPGVSGKWDVWVTSKAPLSNVDDPDITWDVVSLVRLEGIEMLRADAKFLIDYVSELTCSNKKRCFYFKNNEAWWMTSAQAGFEVWADGENLKSVQLSASPSERPADIKGQGKWHDTPAGKIQHIDSGEYEKGIKFVAMGCDTYSTQDGVDFAIYDVDTGVRVTWWSYAKPGDVVRNWVGTYSTSNYRSLAGWEGRTLRVQASKSCKGVKSTANTAFYYK